MTRVDGATPLIDNPHSLSLPGGTDSTLRAMFAAYSRVTVARELAGGFSGSRVFVVHPIREDGLPELPAVVKIGPLPLVEQEWRAYQRNVQNRLPGVAAIQGPPLVAAEGSTAALRYPLVGSGTFDVETLQQYYRHASADDLRYVLELRLFRQLGALWRFSRPAPNFALRDSYDYLLPVNLIVRPTALPDGARLHVLQPGSRQADRLEPGDYVRLQEFVVAERDAGTDEITLNLPKDDQGQPRSYRVRLAQVPAPQEFEMGSVVHDLTGRILNTRRAMLAAYALEVWGVTFAVDAEAFTLPGGRSLPNPLTRLRTVLAATPTVRVAAIHGDLNPQNVLLDTETREVRLIDFADARHDHVLHDLLRLETGILTRLLPESLLEGGLPPQVVVGLYERLAQDPVAAAADVAPPLAKATALLAAVRRAARDYLYDPDDWLEYWQGLTIYLLGAHKYANLSNASKKAAFLAAATTQHLVARSALRARPAPAPASAARWPRPPAREEPSPAAEPPTAPAAPVFSAPAPAPAWQERLSIPPWLPALVALLAVLALLGSILLLDGGSGGETATSIAGEVAANATASPSATSRPPASTATVATVPAIAALPSATAGPAQPTSLVAVTPDCAARGANSSVVVLLDLSQSMHGVRLLSAIVALKRFIACLDPSADIAVYTFDDAVQSLQPSAPMREVAGPLQERLDTLFAGGESALYDAVCQVMDTFSSDDAGQPHTLVLLSDGPDTASTRITSEDSLLDCLAPNVRLYAIAYGPEADAELLARLAELSSGAAYEADPATIDRVLQTVPLP